jgi:hypothetical protein
MKNDLFDDNRILSQQISDMAEKFGKINNSGKKRDLGELAHAKPTLVAKAVNEGTAKANRCLEISSGSPINEGEENDLCKGMIEIIRKRGGINEDDA